MLGQHQLEMMCAGPSEKDGTLTQEVHGFCDIQGTFHSFEGPDGRRMVMAMKALEEKILARVETTLLGMRQDIQQNKSKAQAQSWMLRNIVAEQKDLSTRVDELSKEAFESRSDLMAQIDEVSREALESRSDLMTRVEELSQEAFEARLDCLASLEDLEQKIESSNIELEEDTLPEVCVRKPGDAELEVLETHRAKISDLVAKLEDKANVGNLLAGLQNAVTSATKKSVAKSDPVADLHMDQALEKQLTALELDVAGHTSSTTLKEPKSLDAWLKWPALGAAEVSYSDKALFSSSMKIPPCSSFNKKSSFVAPTFNVHRPRPVAHLTSSQSMPFLAPLF